MNQKAWIATLLVVLGLAPPLLADTKKGLAALERGEHQAAHREFLAAAEAGDAEAQFQLGLLMFSSETNFQDVEQAIREFRRASEQGHVRAQVQLGYALSHLPLMFRAEGASEEERARVAEAASWFEKAAEKGSGYAAAQLVGIARWSRGSIRPRGDYLRFVQAAAESGDATSQYELAQRMLRGDGFPRDPARALAWGERAAHGGHRDAQREIGLALLSGQLGPKRPRDGLGLLEAASAQDDPVALFALGKAFLEGKGVPRNAKFAFLLAGRARDAGFPDAEAMSQLFSAARQELERSGVNPASLSPASHPVHAQLASARQQMRDWFLAGRAAAGGRSPD